MICRFMPALAVITTVVSVTHPALAEITNLDDLPRVERDSLSGSKISWSRHIMKLKAIATTVFLLSTPIQVLTVSPVLALPIPDQSQISQESRQLEPEIEEALKKFSALSSRLDVGLTYQNYLKQVADLKVVLDQVPLKSRSNPACSNLSLAFEYYRFALDVWQDYLGQDSEHGFLTPSSSYSQLLIEQYQAEFKDIEGEKYIYLNDALSKVWDQANINVTKVTNR